MEQASVLIVAAEESSSLYALRLLEKWKTEGLSISAFGVGSREMEMAGFHRLGHSEEMAVVGLSEILSHWKTIKSTYYSILEECRKKKPKYALLMDYPGFNLRLAKELKKMGIPVIYYISPQLWAWKEGRIKTMRAYVDHVLVLFPFEEEFYKKRNVKATFVGHPILDELSDEQLSSEAQQIKRNKFGVASGKKILGLMPGSRKGEIRYNFEAQLQTAQILTSQDPQLHVQVLLAPSLKKSDLPLQNISFPLSVIQLKPFEMISMCDVILCASGTATLMVGLMEKPMVIMYKAHALTAWLARRLVKISHVGLVNIIAQREIVPELLQEDANPEKLAQTLKDLLYNQQKHDQMVHDLRNLKTLLGSRGATDRVAEILRQYL
ncbi:MAG: lipid-A-disaccharide synthase [Bdellovibrionales bacterium]